MRKNIFIYVNAFLIVGICISFLINIYHKKVIFNLDKKTGKEEIISFLKTEFGWKKRKNFILFYVFNSIPFSEQLESIEKINFSLRNFDIFVVFCKRFNFPFHPHFSFKFKPEYRFYVTTSKRNFNKNYFIFLKKDGKILHVDSDISFEKTIFVLKEKIRKKNRLSRSPLKEKILRTLKKKKVFLYYFPKDSYINIFDYNFSALCFLPFVCANDKFKKILSLNNKALFIFPIFVNSYKIKNFLRNAGFLKRAFFDRKDEFGLLFSNVEVDKTILCFNKEDIDAE